MLIIKDSNGKVLAEIKEDFLEITFTDNNPANNVTFAANQQFFKKQLIEASRDHVIATIDRPS